MHDVITVGSSTIDIFVETGNNLFRKAHYKGCVMVPFGSKIIAKDLRVSTGGGGTNTAVCLSKLGLKVAYLGKMGTGPNGARVLEELKKAKVDTSLVCREKARTGLSVILDAKGHDRTILAYKGSNDDLGWADVRKGKINAKWMYCSSMMGTSFNTLKKLVALARKKGIKVAFNPSSYLAKKGIGYIKGIVSNTNLLVMNREEANYLAKTMDMRKAAKRLRSYGPDIVVITDGNNKAVAYDGRKHYSIKPHNLKVVEATGAGDAFASTFLAGLIRKNDINFALKLGLANAESVITHFGAKCRLLTWNEAVKKAK